MAAYAGRKDRYEKYRAAGSCQDCGAAALPQRTRCLECGRRHSAWQTRRRQDLVHQLVERVTVLEEQVQSLQMAAPRGIPTGDTKGVAK